MLATLEENPADYLSWLIYLGRLSGLAAPRLVPAQGPELACVRAALDVARETHEQCQCLLGSAADTAKLLGSFFGGAQSLEEGRRLLGAFLLGISFWWLVDALVLIRLALRRGWQRFETHILSENQQLPPRQFRPPIELTFHRGHRSRSPERHR